MPDAVSQLGAVGGIAKALLDCLDKIENQVAASLVGPDGKPSGTAIYMHMPIGSPVDPKMFANPWSPAGGSSSSSFSNDGAFTAPATPTASTTPPAGPPGSVYPPPAKPDPQLEQSIQAAFFTSKLVDQMLAPGSAGPGVATGAPPASSGASATAPADPAPAQGAANAQIPGPAEASANPALPAGSPTAGVQVSAPPGGASDGLNPASAGAAATTPAVGTPATNPQGSS